MYFDQYVFLFIITWQHQTAENDRFSPPPPPIATPFQFSRTFGPKTSWIHAWCYDRYGWLVGCYEDLRRFSDISAISRLWSRRSITNIWNVFVVLVVCLDAVCTMYMFECLLCWLRGFFFRLLCLSSRTYNFLFVDHSFDVIPWMGTQA